MNIIIPLCPVHCGLIVKPTLSVSLLLESFHLVFILPLNLFPGSGASNILLGTRRSSDSLLTCPLKKPIELCDLFLLFNRQIACQVTRFCNLFKPMICPIFAVCQSPSNQINFLYTPHLKMIQGFVDNKNY